LIRNLARRLEHDAPGVSASILEGLDEILTVTRLNVEVLECAAAELNETQSPLDASICRLGLMLFPSPRGALRAVQRRAATGRAFFWFALNEDRPLFGYVDHFKGDRGTKSKPIPGPHLVYGFLTTAPNAVVEPHPSQGDAGDPDDARGARCLDARALG
jgi:hypothetical protein